MRDVNGHTTVLAAAIALACGAAGAQDERRQDERVLQDEHVERIEQHANTDADAGVDFEVARGEEVLQEGEPGHGAAGTGELADEVEDRHELAQERSEIEQMAEDAIAQLRAEDPEAAERLDSAYGYAVFDTTKAGLIVTGAGGTGVATVQGGDHRTFMHLGGAGIGLGAGGENYRLVMVFQEQQRYDEFVEGEWEAGASAQAAAGDEGAATDVLTEGIQLYRLTDAGLFAQVDLTGMKFWPSEELNGEDLDTDVALR